MTVAVPFPLTPCLVARISRQRPLGAIVALAAAVAIAPIAAPTTALAQFPGLPVIENGFVHAGRVGAFNLGLTEGSTAYVVAGSWVPESERWKVVGGAGYLSREPGDGAIAGGVRGAYPLDFFGANEATSPFGMAAFIGTGGFASGGVTTLTVPAGVGVGYRSTLGETRAFAISGAPYFGYTRAWGTDEGTDLEIKASSFVLRLGVGVDFSFTPRVGLSAGLDFGVDPSPGDPGSRGTVLGLGAGFRF